MADTGEIKQSEVLKFDNFYRRLPLSLCSPWQKVENFVLRDNKGGTGFPGKIMDDIYKVKLSRKNDWLLAEDGSLRLSESRGRYSTY